MLLCAWFLTNFVSLSSFVTLSSIWFKGANWLVNAICECGFDPIGKDVMDIGTVLKWFYLL